MPIFEYKAIDGANKVKKGIIDADTTRDARQKLKKDRLFVTDIKEAKGKKDRAVRIRGVTALGMVTRFTSSASPASRRPTRCAPSRSPR